MTYDGVGNKLERTMNGREIWVYSLIQGVGMDEVHRYNDKTGFIKVDGLLQNTYLPSSVFTSSSNIGHVSDPAR